MDLGAPPGERPQDYWHLRMAEIFGWMPDDLCGLSLAQIHDAHIYAMGDD